MVLVISSAPILELGHRCVLCIVVAGFADGMRNRVCFTPVT